MCRHTDDALHATYLGVGVFKKSDGSEDLRESNESVRTDLTPNVDRSGPGVTSLINTGVGRVSTRAHSVNVELSDGGPDHGQSSEEESSGNPLNRGESDVPSTQEGVDDQVEDRNEDDKRDRVDVVDDIVRHVVQLHDGSLGGQVSGHLVVSQPVDGVEQEAAQATV